MRAVFAGTQLRQRYGALLGSEGEMADLIRAIRQQDHGGEDGDDEEEETGETEEAAPQIPCGLHPAIAPASQGLCDNCRT